MPDSENWEGVPKRKNKRKPRGTIKHVVNLAKKEIRKLESIIDNTPLSKDIERSNLEARVEELRILIDQWTRRF